MLYTAAPQNSDFSMIYDVGIVFNLVAGNFLRVMPKSC